MWTGRTEAKERRWKITEDPIAKAEIDAFQVLEAAKDDNISCQGQVNFVLRRFSWGSFYLRSCHSSGSRRW